MHIILYVFSRKTWKMNHNVSQIHLCMFLPLWTSDFSYYSETKLNRMDNYFLSLN